MTDTLPLSIDYVRGSARPEPGTVAPMGGFVVWETDDVPVEGLTYTLRVKPVDPGEHGIGHSVITRFEDTRGRHGIVALPVPRVMVEPPGAVLVYPPIARKG